MLAKLALFYDWILYSPNTDNIMNIGEQWSHDLSHDQSPLTRTSHSTHVPLTTLSSPDHSISTGLPLSGMTNQCLAETVLVSLIQLVTTFCPSLQSQVLSGIKAAFDDIIRKGVLV